MCLVESHPYHRYSCALFLSKPTGQTTCSTVLVCFHFGLTILFYFLINTISFKMPHSSRISARNLESCFSSSQISSYGVFLNIAQLICIQIVPSSIACTALLQINEQVNLIGVLCVTVWATGNHWAKYFRSSGVRLPVPQSTCPKALEALECPIWIDVSAGTKQSKDFDSDTYTVEPVDIMLEETPDTEDEQYIAKRQVMRSVKNEMDYPGA